MNKFVIVIFSVFLTTTLQAQMFANQGQQMMQQPQRVSPSVGHEQSGAGVNCYTPYADRYNSKQRITQGYVNSQRPNPGQQHGNGR